MPIPIQVGSLTDRLRRFLRLRGRVRLQLDETVVPTVQVQDLTVGPYQAGVSPCAGTTPPFNAVVGSQFLILINPDATLPVDLPAVGPDLTGRSFTAESLIASSTASNISMRVGLVPRGSLGAATLTNLQSLLLTQEGSGINTVPVVIANVPAVVFVIFPAVQEFFRGGQNIGANNVLEIPLPRGLTIAGPQVVVLESLIASNALSISVSGFYQQLPN